MRSGPNSDCQERSRKRRKCTISRRARSFSAVANRTLDSRKKQPPLSLSRRLRGTSETRSRHQFSPCCHSRAQIFRLVRRISIYLIYMFPTSRRRRRRIAQLNTIRSVLVFFSFFFCNYFTVSARAVDRRIRCKSSISELFLSFRVIA